MSACTDELYHGKIIPPSTDRITKLERAPRAIRVRKAAQLLLGGGFIVFVSLILSKLVVFWLLFVGIAIGGFVVYLAINAYRNGSVGICPYCGSIVGGGDDRVSSDDDNMIIECPTCHELLVSHQGSVRAMNTEDVPGGREFAVSLIENGIWPGECIVCGGPVERTNDSASTGFNTANLLIGRISLSTGSMRQIPYCAKHSNAVRVTMKDDSPKLIFDDFGALRRYVAANKKRT